MTEYKVRNRITGKFSSGGVGAVATADSKFNTKGKVWKRIGDLRCHLNQLSSLENLDVEEYERQPSVYRATIAAEVLLQTKGKPKAPQSARYGCGCVVNDASPPSKCHYHGNFRLIG